MARSPLSTLAELIDLLLPHESEDDASDEIPPNITSLPYLELMNFIETYTDKCDRHSMGSRQRHAFTWQMSWTILDRPTLMWIAQQLVDHDIGVDISAGKGLLVRLLNDPQFRDEFGQKFATIHGVDINPSSKTFTSIEKMSAEDAVCDEKYNTAVPIICWAMHNSTYATTVLQNTKSDLVIVCGEGDYGCTADDSFFRELEANWTEKAYHEPKTWGGINDEWHSYERNTSVS